MVTSSQMFGFMIGSVLGGTMSDRLGRRPVYLSSIFLQASSSIAVSLTHNLFVIYIFMFLCGIGMIIRGMVGMVILNEVVPNAHRKNVGILAVISESLSGVLISLLAWLLPNWRWMVGSISAALFLIFIPIAMFVGESSKWLLQMKNQKKAKKLNQNDAKICKDESDTSCECEEINVSPEETSKQQKVAKYTYLDIVKVDFIRRRICILSFAWFAADMAFYGLTFNTNNLGGNRYINSFLSGAVEFPAQFVCFMVVRRIGCRRSFIVSTIITSMCLALTPLLHEVNEWAGVVSAMLGKLVITVGYTILFIFTGDLFPTMMRTQSYGACSFMARFGSILVPYILFLGKTVHSSLPYVIMSAISLLSAIAMVFLPETMGLPIPDTLEDARSHKRYCVAAVFK
uniref:Major facilitator superfamily (MFS) profile domain-containing protein n=1 Tax=Ciona savignyi TaxID=51511 RepID=H2ZH84_CIOSA